MAKVRFVPQAWVRDNAITIDHDEASAVYDVGEIPSTTRSRSYESDAYQTHANAPAWVREHQGPFDVIVLSEEE